MLLISALQHYLFCPRQCALIHLEQVWAENQFTAEGQVLHKRAHDGADETRPGVRVTRGLPVASEALDISGVCDVVEFHGDFSGRNRGRQASVIAAVVPVEYKRGKPKAHRADEVQLCAQALCLEEMTGLSIPFGHLFYGERRRRTEVAFDAELRGVTTGAITALRLMLELGQTPPAVYEAAKCHACSLRELCLPEPLSRKRRAGDWFARALAQEISGSDPL